MAIFPRGGPTIFITTSPGYATERARKPLCDDSEIKTISLASFSSPKDVRLFTRRKGTPPEATTSALGGVVPLVIFEHIESAVATVHSLGNVPRSTADWGASE